MYTYIFISIVIRGYCSCVFDLFIFQLWMNEIILNEINQKYHFETLCSLFGGFKILFIFVIRFFNCKLQVVFFIEFDLEFLKGNVVSIGSMLINDLIRQPLIMSKDWGDLLKSEAGLKHKRAFEGDFIQFCTFLESKLNKTRWYSFIYPQKKLCSREKRIFFSKLWWNPISSFYWRTVRFMSGQYCA